MIALPGFPVYVIFDRLVVLMKSHWVLSIFQAFEPYLVFTF